MLLVMKLRHTCTVKFQEYMFPVYLLYEAALRRDNAGTCTLYSIWRMKLSITNFATRVKLPSTSYNMATLNKKFFHAIRPCK